MLLCVARLRQMHLKCASYSSKEEKEPDEQSGVVVTKKHSAQPADFLILVKKIHLIADTSRY